VIDILNGVFLMLAVLMLLPVGVFATQILLAVWPAGHRNLVAASPEARRRVAVLVPAHDEALGIEVSLRSMLAQLGPRDRLLVVADNCSDNTASVARAAGAEVVERFDAHLRGKGYALDFGVRHLEKAPPEVVVVVDADCELGPRSLELLATACANVNRPIQALYLMHAPPQAGLKTRIAAFAWVVKNQVRPLGYGRLGLPCQLMGTGMAFPWATIQSAPLASGHIVEDMQLGLDLARSGRPPLFCQDALVTSFFPSDARGIADQRSRWEEGHVGVIIRHGLPALWHALLTRNRDLAAMVLDLCVPPLTMLVMLLVAQAIVTGVLFAVDGASYPFALALLSLALMSLAVGMAWARFGRRIVSLRELTGIPLYILSKLPLYSRFLRSGKREWVRTRRDEPPRE
jgi:cellulose synthase/poly-beta-1,6-N-acetylglucosamine synthase-like glycosyltransferase